MSEKTYLNLLRHIEGAEFEASPELIKPMMAEGGIYVATYCGEGDLEKESAFLALAMALIEKNVEVLSKSSYQGCQIIHKQLKQYQVHNPLAVGAYYEFDYKGEAATYRT